MENATQTQTNEHRRRDNFEAMLMRNKGRIFYEVIFPNDPQPTTIERNLTFSEAMETAASGVHPMILAIIPFDGVIEFREGSIWRHQINLPFDKLNTLPKEQREPYMTEQLLSDALARLMSGTAF